MDSGQWKRITAGLTEEQEMEQERLRQAQGGSGPESDPAECRRCLEAEHGRVWNSFELARDYELEAFTAPNVVVTRRADGVRGTLVFQHDPRFYWGFKPD